MNKGLLVVTRKRGEVLHVTTTSGDVIEFVVIQCSTGKARVGVKCDKKFRIGRSDSLSSDEEMASEESMALIT